MSKRPVKSPGQANANWASAMASPQASQKYTQGVSSVNESPNAAAARPEAVAKYVAKVNDAASSGRLAAKNNAVPLQKWKDAATQGASRLASGAAKGKQNHMDAAQRLAPGWQAMRDAANAIPHDGSSAAAVARFTAAMQAMKSHVGKSGG